MKIEKPRIDADRLGVCLEMPLSDRPFPDRIRTAAALGFRNAEMWMVDNSFRGEPEELAAIARDAGIVISNTVVGAPDGSVGGGLTDPDRFEQWIDRIRLTFDFNVRAGIPATILCTGNTIDNRTDTEIRTSVYDGLCRTAELAEKMEINLFLEPLNIHVDHPGYYLIDSDTGAELCREVGSKRLKLLYDAYHMQIMEGNIIEHIRRNIDVIGHIHIAGVPGRNEPELGEVDYPFVLSKAVEFGYDGLVGLEYMPTFDHEESLRSTVAYLTGEGPGQNFS